ncbi:MAG: hypothetical protein ACXVEF_39850 [Polyangiales bacterium]
MRLRFVAVLTIALAGSFAYAKGESSIVHLKNGTVLRGELLERLPGDHVTIKLASGEKKRVDWNDVDSIEDGAAEATSGSASASGAAAPPSEAPTEAPSASASVVPSASAAPAPSGVRVRLTGTPNVSLERRDGSKWTFACLAPCSHPVEEGEYRVGGEGVNPSSTFVLRDPTQVAVKAGSKGRAFGGQLLLGAGAGALLIGIFMATGDNTDVAIPVIAIGGAAAVGGLTLWLTNRTSITLSPEGAGLKLRGTTSLF